MPEAVQLTAENGAPLRAPAAVTEPLGLSVRAEPETGEILKIRVEPAAMTLSVAAAPAVPHYFRLADGTVKVLPPAPPPLACQAGDAYIAVTPAAARLAEGEPGGASAALARFIHLRDYFNAETLARAVLAHLLELGSEAEPAGAGVLVVEARRVCGCQQTGTGATAGGPWTIVPAGGRRQPWALRGNDGIKGTVNELFDGRCRSGGVLSRT